MRSRLVLVGLLAVLASGPSQAQRIEPLPGDLDSVEVTQKLDGQIPLDLSFVDEQGQPVELGRLFASDRPVLLTLVYYECPMLCTLVLNGVVDTLREMAWTPGDQFEMVTVSIDPDESPNLALQKKRSYLDALGRPEAAAGWHFLTGEADAIRQLADSVGFGFRYLEDQDEFAHPAAVFVLTPEGRISRYLFGVAHDPQTLRLSLVEAGEGRIGNVVDKFLLYCYRYDPEEGRYAPVARKIMRLGGLLAVLVLGATLLTFWIREIRQKRLA